MVTAAWPCQLSTALPSLHTTTASPPALALPFKDRQGRGNKGFGVFLLALCSGAPRSVPLHLSPSPTLFPKSLENKDGPSSGFALGCAAGLGAAAARLSSAAELPGRVLMCLP